MTNFNQVPRIASALLLCLAASAIHAGDLDNLALRTSEAGTYYLAGSIDSLVHTEFLVDTGAGYVSLSDKTFRTISEIESTILLRHINARMANGRIVTVPVYQVEELALSENCVLRNIEVTVVKNSDRDILGLNAIRALQPVTLQLDPPVLSVSCPVQDS